MSTYKATTPEEAFESHKKFFQRRIDAYNEDVEYLTVEFLKAQSIGNIEKSEDCQQALLLAEACLTNAKATLSRYIAGEPFINN